MPKPLDCDCLILGAGLAGMALAAALGRQGLAVVVVERRPGGDARTDSGADERGLALAPVSREILAALGVWAPLESESTPIRRIHISQVGGFWTVSLDAAEFSTDALGYVVPAPAIERALLGSLASLPAVRVIRPAEVQDLHIDDHRVRLEVRAAASSATLTAPLIIGADGAASSLRQQLGLQARSKDYRQTAVVAGVTLARPLEGLAYERFTPAGPLAILPMRDRNAKCVWVEDPDSAARLLTLAAKTFATRLEERMGGRLGTVSGIGRRQAFPLRSIYATRSAGRRFALLGNAATSVHPNAAQGFNLGLRDVAAAAELILDEHRRGRDPGLAIGGLDAQRRDDRLKTWAATDGIARLFYNSACVPRAARGVAMAAAATVPALRFAIARQGMGFAAASPLS
jgi:2-octaprenyl-6-methoxyphenol hydroxylase